jgi:phosphoglucomutase
MNVDPTAGQPADASMLANIPRLVTSYYALRPDPAVPAQRVAFGPSGHRGCSLAGAFNEPHILAITQAICQHRREQEIDGPLFLGMDTHALSEPALATALEVLAANDVHVMLDARDGCTPTPAVSHAILNYNRGRATGRADGIVVTPSHNPPEEGGFTYQPPSGGPAPTDVAAGIEDEANALLAAGGTGVRRVPFERARRAATTHRYDYLDRYTSDLGAVVDLDAVRGGGIAMGVDPLGGAGVRYWDAIAERFGISITVVNDQVDPTFRFMTVDWDGKIRMDCSSPHAMRRLIALRDRFDVAWGCDPDHDRHGVVVPGQGLMNPNQYLAAVASYLFAHRPGWNASARPGLGKTIVTTGLLDRVAARLGRPLVELPVGFEWFVDGLLADSLGLAGDESAGASCLRRDGRVWTTDKDGIVLGLVAAEMTAVMGRHPGEVYRDLTRELGEPVYQRIDAPATAVEKARLSQLSARDVPTGALEGERIMNVLTRAPGNDSPIGGVKVVTEHGWFAARPSGTEDVYTLYAESFEGPDHLARLVEGAQSVIERALRHAAA